MNKFIKTDIEQGLQYLKIAIMNALADIESGEEEEIDFGDYIPFSLIKCCCEERNYLKSDDFETNGWDCDCWYRITTPLGKKVCIESSLWYGTSRIYIDEND